MRVTPDVKHHPVIPYDSRVAVLILYILRSDPSPGQTHDAVEGRKLLNSLDRLHWPRHLLRNKAYKG